jgi:YNFM family putative membrane transporter
MASQMTALHAKKENLQQLPSTGFSIISDQFLGSGTGYLLHSTSWNVFIGVLILVIMIAFALTIEHKSLKTE